MVYNRVGDHGQTISDRNIKLRNAKVCRELTERFGLHLAPGKEALDEQARLKAKEAEQLKRDAAKLKNK